MSEIRVNKITNRSGLGTITVSNAGAVFGGEKTGFGTDNPRYTLEVGAVGAGGTQLWVNGDARVTGIMSIGQGTITLDPDLNMIKLGALTMHRDSVTGDALLMSTNGDYNPFRASKFLIDATEVIDNNRNFTGVDANFSGNVSVGGTLTYEDVTNIDSVGLITARNGLHVTGGSVGIGTNSPSALLHLSGSAPIIKLQDNNNTGVSALQRIDAVPSTGGTQWFAGQNSTTTNDLYLYNVANANLLFGTNNTERFRIDSSGNVGIGTNDPDQRLHVLSTNGTAAVIESTKADSSLIRFVNASAGNVYIGAKDTNDFFIRTGASERLRITSTGNVGIGTDAPTQKLVVKGNGDGIRIEDGSGTDGYNIFRDDPTGFLHFVGDQTTFSGYRFFTNDTDERLTILNNGNIGIGTDNPASRLDVRNASGTDPLLSLHHSNADVDGEVIRIGRVDIPTIRYHSIKAFHSGGASANYIAFNLHDASSVTSQSEVLRLRGDGNVGIGTNVPGHKLHVLQQSTDTYGTGVARFTYIDTNASNNAGNPTTHFDAQFKPGHSYFKSFITGNSSDFLIVDQDNSDTRAAFEVQGSAGSKKVIYAASSGKVGIGIITPGANLDVFGTARIGGTVASGRRADFDTNGRLTLAYGDNNNDSNLILQNLALDASTNHGNNIKWQFATNASSTAINAARINVIKEQQWTSTTSTQNSAFTIDLAQNGSLDEKLRITSTGEVTKPKQPGFYARRTTSGDGRAAGGITEWHISGTGSYNEGGHFKTSGADQGKFVAPVTGKYYFAAQPGYKQTNNNFQFYFRINTVAINEPVRVIDGGDDLTSHSAFTGSCIVHMTAGQKFDVYIGNTHHVNTTHNFFCGYLIG